MSYTIAFTPKGATTVFTAEKPNAGEAWQAVEALELNNDVLAYIRGPEGHDMGRGELQIQALLEARN